MIKIRWTIGNCNILIINYDLQLNRLINSFMHRKFEGEAAQPIVQCGYNNRLRFLLTTNQSLIQS